MQIKDVGAVCDGRIRVGLEMGLVSLSKWKAFFRKANEIGRGWKEVEGTEVQNTQQALKVVEKKQTEGNLQKRGKP